MNNKPKMFEELLHKHVRVSYQQDDIHFQEKTEFQDLVIFSNPTFGRMMALDHITQTTERDESYYHEMLAHVPLFAHPNPEKVLIIGGGDGGLLREVLKHPVKQVTMVELDESVVNLSKQYLPNICQNAFADARLKLVFQDGAKFVEETKEKYDIILIDSTDPIGPGEVLFREAFYKACKNLMNENGIFARQNGVPFLQPEELQDTYKKLQRYFADPYFFLTVVPSYFGGFMTLGWGTDNLTLRKTPLATIEAKFNAYKFATEYYTPEMHQASFCLPQFIRALLTHRRD